MKARSTSRAVGIHAPGIRVLGLRGAALLAVTMAPATALAHHSFAMFDRDKQVTVNGTVHDFQWTNPHAWIDIDVPGSQGLEKWGIELNSPNNLARQGWRSNVMKPGDKVTVVLNPLRSGEKGGLFLQATLSGGKVITDTYLARVNAAASSAPTASAPAK